MKQKSSQIALRKTIAWLETENAAKQELLITEIRETFDGLKPINLLKDSIKQAVGGASGADNFLIPILGNATGYLAKRLVVGSSESRGRQLLGAGLQMGISRVVAQHPTEIRMAGTFILRFLMGRKKPRKQDEDPDASDLPHNGSSTEPDRAPWQ